MSSEFYRYFPDWTVVRDGAFGTRRVDALETALWRDDIGLLTLSRLGEAAAHNYRLKFSDEISIDLFLLERAIVETVSRPNIPKSTSEHFLVDQVLPRMLAHQGNLVLHAGAVNHEDHAFVILGKSGSGKSTLVASFAQARAALLGDDACVVSWSNGEAGIQSVYPSLRLLPDSIAQFFPGSVTSSVAHYSPKQRVQFENSAALPAALPIRTLLAIAAPSCNGSIEIRRMTIAEGCMAIIENSFMLDPTDMQRVRTRMVAATALATQVPVFEIAYPHDYASLPEVRAAILAHLY